MRSPHRWATAHPRWALGSFALLVAVAACGLPRLQVRTDAQVLLPVEHPVSRLDRALRTEFDVEETIAVLIHRPAPGGVLHGPTLQRLQRLTAQIAELSSVRPRDVASLATERTDRVRPGHYRFATLLDPMPSNDRELAALRQDLEEIRLYTGSLLSADSETAAILVGVAPEVDRQAVVREVAELVDRARQDALAGPSAEVSPGSRVTFHLTGAPVAEVSLGLEILRELGVPGVALPDARASTGFRIGLAGGALLLIGAIVWLAYRRPAAVLLPWFEAAAAVILVLGSMGWVGAPLTITTTVLPIVLVAVGVTDEIHVLSHFFERFRNHPDESKRLRVIAVFDSLARPIAQTSATTAFAFASFAASPIPAVQAFGGFAALGVLFCWLFTMVAGPALLVLLPAAWLRPRPVGSRSRVWPMLAHCSRRRRRWVIGGFFASVAVAAMGISRLEVQDSWVDGFAASSPMRLDTELAHRQLDGTHVLRLALLAPPQTRAFAKPSVLAGVCRFEARIARLEHLQVGDVHGPCAHLSTFHYLSRGRREVERRVPAEPRRIAWLWDEFGRVRGTYRLHEVVDEGLDRTLTTVFLRAANYRDTKRLLAEIEAVYQEDLAPHGLEMQIGGDVAVSQALIEAVVQTEVRSLLLSLAAILGLSALFFRSVRWAVLCTLPCALAVVANFGLMGSLGIPLGVATSLFPAMILGIGIDYAVHLVTRYRVESRATTPAVARHRALAAIGPAIRLDAMVVGTGFGLLLFSEIPANARFGGLFLASVAVCCLATLALLPALLAWLEPEADALVAK